MTFAELLDDYMQDRRLETITCRCAEQGVSLAVASLSRYRTGIRLPTDERIVRAIARACDKDPEPLVFQWLVESDPATVLAAVLDAVTDGGKGPSPTTVNGLVDYIRALKRGMPPERPVTVEVRINGQMVSCVAHTPGTVPSDANAGR